MTIMLPKVDAAFKLLFGDERSKNILTDFLKAALPELVSVKRVPYPLRGGVPASVFGLCLRPDKGGGGSDYRVICSYRNKGCTAAFELPYGIRDCSAITGRSNALSCE